MMKLHVVAGLVLTLSACVATRTPYNRPSIDLPARYVHADENAKASLNQWWQAFGDPNLDTLVAHALKSNTDLALAVLGVRAAQFQAHLAVTNPVVEAGYTYEQWTPLAGSFPATQFHSLTASATYQLDFWGQLRSLRDAAQWEVRATEVDRQNAALTLVVEVVGLYYQIAAFNHLITLQDQSIAYARSAFDLTKVLCDAGATSKLPMIDAELNIQNQEAARTRLAQQRDAARNALVIALGGMSWPKSAEMSVVPESPPPPVAADLPVSLLERRPDLRAAELRLRETLAQTDATRVSFYPTLSLTSSLGTASNGLSELISNPIASLAGVLAVPFVQYNQAKFATRLARVHYDIAVVTFQKTLLSALMEVDTALSERLHLAEEGVYLEKALRAAKTSENLNGVLYTAGAIPLRNWLDAQEKRRQLEISLVSSRLDRLQNYIILCRALGGDARDLVK
jgi:NodT family efflux transporter outer membrane factor (OMF) lipoprotein